MVPHGKELSEDLKRRIVALHEDSQGYKKIDNTLKLSCSTVANITKRFKRAGSTQKRPRVGRPKKLSAWMSFTSKCFLPKIGVGDLSALLQILKRWGVSLLVLRLYAALYIKLGAWLTPREDASSEDDTLESPQTVWWRHVNKAHGLLEPYPMVWWDEDYFVWFRWLQACVAATRRGVQRYVCHAYN